MLRGIKARIGIVTLGILVLCVSAFGIFRVFADPNYSIIAIEDDIYDYDDENVVELDGIYGEDFSLSLIIDDYYYIARNLEGSFVASNPYITPTGCDKEVSNSSCNVNTGQFSLNYNGASPLYNLFTMHYYISPDTPAGVYDLSVNVNSFLAQANDDTYFIDLGEVTPRTDFEVTVKRPHDIIFEDADGNPITEITKFLGDDDFIVDKRTGSGDGDFSDYYIDYGYDEDVVSIDSDSFHILKAGMTKVCTYADEYDLYLSSEACFTINVEPILTHSVSVSDVTHGETTDDNPAVVELDGTENVEITVSLNAKNAFRMLNLGGRFVPYNDYGVEPSSLYFRLTSVRSPRVGECEVDSIDGSFDCEYDSIETDGNWFSEDEAIVEATYTVYRDAPAGLYHLPIHIESIAGRTITSDGGFENGTDFDEGMFNVDVSVAVKRPQRVVFWDENDQAVTEVNKTFGDPDFIITKAVYEGDGSIDDYYIDSESEDGVVSIVPDSDYIRVLKAGTARICASISETEFYLPGKSCFTINVEPREIWVKKLTLVDKQYDGNNSVEIDELLFYTFGLDGTPIYVNLEPSDYYIYGLVVDNPNVGQRTADVEIQLNENSSKYFYLAESTYTVPVAINPVPLQDMSATASSKEFDGESQFPAVTPVVGMSDSGEVSLEEDVDFEISYDNGPVYVDGQFVNAGDYLITVSPKAGSNYTFEPFEVTYTISPKIVSISGVEVDDREYDRTNEASVSMVSFVECSLTKGEDYEAYAYLDGSDAGMQDGTVYVALTNQNYSFYYDDLLGMYIYQDTFDVSDVEISPKTLTNNNTSYDVDGYSNAYTGEEIKPFIYLSISFVDGELPEDPLSLGYDYEIEYPADTVNSGMKYATITGKGNFRGSIGPLEYLVYPASVQNMMVSTSNQTYTGGPLEPEPVVMVVFGGERITLPASEYEILHQDDFVDVGDYTYTIQESHNGNFHFSAREESFTIEPKEITVVDADVDDKNIDWNYDATVNWVEFSYPNLIKDVDYTAYATLESFEAGTWDGTVYVTLLNTNYCFGETSTDSYSHETTFDVSDVTIFPRELTSQNSLYTFSDGPDWFIYSGYENKPQISLSAGLYDGASSSDYVSLVLGSDYTVTYNTEDTVNVGKKYVTLNGINNFADTIGPIEYTVVPYLLTDVEITTPSQVYSGEPLTPEPVVTGIMDENRITIPSSNYSIEKDGNLIDAGDYTFSIVESDNSNFYFQNPDQHLPKLSSTFTIEPYEITSSNISLSQSAFKHNGTSQTPSVTVTVGDTAISEHDYDVEFSADTIGNDDSDTEVTVTVTAKDGANISGSASTTYTITPRDVLTIAGIDDNQQIEYTGSPVALHGNVMVEENPAGIVAEDLTVTWYASDGTTIIDQPTNAGSYKVVYSYEDADYSGALVVNFEITKATSPAPAEMSADFSIESGKTLADLDGARTNGFAWLDDSTVVVPGSNVYPATYVYNNDAVNYETLNLNVPVYGLTKVDVTTSESEGGKITVSSQNVLEGEAITVTITPSFGYVLSSITVNGVNYIGSVNANTLEVVAGADDLEIVATFVPIVYEVIEGAEQVYTVGEDNGAEFRINANYSLFENGGTVYVDDALVDPNNYTSWDGSTYVKFTDVYMNTLAVGTHTLKVVFTDGGSATTTFVVARPADEGGNEEEKEEEDLPVPGTGIFTTVSGGAAGSISLLAVVIIILGVIRRVRWLMRRV